MALPLNTMNEIITQQEQPQSDQSITELMLSGGPQFEHIQRVAKMFSASSLVPEQFQGNIGNCVIAMEMAQRMKANALAVMQNIYIVHGKPGWSSAFLIASLNTCGRFEPLRYDVTGEGKNKTCIAWTVDKGRKLEQGQHTLELAMASGVPVYQSPPVSIQLAHDEGWATKGGSKWKTMPDLMLRYRAATFFTRLYAPEITMGMHTEDELVDASSRVRETRGSVVATVQPLEAVKPLEAAVETVEESTSLSPADESLLDFLTLVSECADIDELDNLRSQVQDFDGEGRTKASDAVMKRADVMGYVWSEKDGFVSRKGGK